jgi:hypothetical protein
MKRLPTLPDITRATTALGVQLAYKLVTVGYHSPDHYYSKILIEEKNEWFLHNPYAARRHQGVTLQP